MRAAQHDTLQGVKDLSRLTLSAISMVVLSFSNEALANLYVTAGAYYSKAENASDQSGPGSSIGIGYELNPNWSIEFGYDQLIDEDGAKPYLIDYPKTINLGFDDPYQNKGLILSALGKTQIDSTSTLFYRAGLMQSDIRQSVYSQGQQVCKGKPSDQRSYLFVDAQGATFQSATGCEYKQKSTDFMFGLGLQSDFSKQWFGRIEALHLVADKGESITAAKISIGYKF